MVKNKLEKLFSSTVKDQFRWGMKLHNNPLAHQTTPADYIVATDRGTDSFILIECKQVTCKEGKGRLVFKRLKQMHDLIAFSNIFNTFHSSYFCIAYYDTKWTNSEVYLVPAITMKEIISKIDKVSMNREDAKIYLRLYKLELKGGILQCVNRL